METKFKNKVAEELETKLSVSGTSQSQFARKIGVSSSLINHCIKRKFSLISETKMLEIAAAIGVTDSNWKLAPTTNYKLITNTLKTCQSEGMSFALSHNPGHGKSFVCRNYADNHRNVFYVLCQASWNKKQFYGAILKTLGIDPEPYTTPMMVDKIIQALNSKKAPLLILDEADKVGDKIIVFIELYNGCNSGFFLCGAPAFKQRLIKFARKDKVGYKEILSRLGQTFLHLNKVKRKDVELICQYNGIQEKVQIDIVWEEMEKTNDLRRVERMIHKLKYRQKAA